MDNRFNDQLLWKIFHLTLSLALAAGLIYSWTYWERFSASHRAGTIGLTTGPRDSQLHLTIKALTPSSPLVAAGAKPGDSFEYQRRTDAYRALGTDEFIPVRLFRDGKSKDVLIRPAAIPPSPAAAANWVNFLINSAEATVCLIFGLLVGLRGVQDRSLRVLALILLTPTVSFMRTCLPAGAIGTVVAQVIYPVAAWLSYAAFVLFPLLFPSEDPLWRRLPVRAAFLCLTGTFAALTLMIVGQNVRPGSFGGLTTVTTIGWRSVFIQLSVAAAAVAMGLAWRRSTGLDRQRLSWVGLCMGLIFTTFAIYNGHVFQSLLESVIQSSNVLDSIQLIAYALLGYAMLRYRLFDIGFAVNRTLVFSFTSVLLILVFFLIERFVHGVLHFESAENNALLSGAIAFSLFFVFNRLHHRVDHLVEKLLFHSWHANAEHLNAFVTKASHFTSIEYLLAALGRELDRFTGGAGYALYRVDASAGGDFVLVDGTLTGRPMQIGRDDDVGVTLRAQRTPLTRLGTAPGKFGELVLPMLHGAELHGFAILGTKPNGKPYRPDEIDSLNYAISQVGLELFALRVQLLEAAYAEMSRRVESAEDRAANATHEIESIRLALGSMRTQS